MRTKINIFILAMFFSFGIVTACGGGDEEDPTPNTPTQR